MYVAAFNSGTGIKLRPSISVYVFGLIFLTACVVYSIGIGVPVYWHPDEISKASQLQSGNYNFYHPQLMLRLATLFKSLFQAGDSTRELVLSGRVASVFATAVAATALGVLMARRFGLIFGIVTAVLVGLTPTVFIHARHFKEDATLLMGTALTMLALQSVDMNASRRNIILLGLAAGLAASSKYVGIIMLAPAIAMLIAKRARWIDAGYCFAAAVLVFAAINSPGLFGRSSLSTGLMMEINHVMTGHSGIPGSRITMDNIKNFWRSMTPVLVLLWIAGMTLQLWPLKSRPDHGRPAVQTIDRIILFTPLLLLVMLQLATFSVFRYVLPAVALAVVAAIWTAAWVIHTTGNRAARIAVIALLVLAGGATLWTFRTAVLLVAHDPRARLSAWISSNLPPDAKIATEFYTGLPTAERVRIDPTIPTMPQEVATSYGHLGTHGLHKLYEMGITHIAISSTNYGRFFEQSLPDALIPTKQFYEDVFARFKPIYESRITSDVHHIATSDLTVYDIRTQSSR